MSRTDVLRKLIALEPITAGQIHAVCGWPAGDVDKALDELLRAGLVTFKHYGYHRWYVTVAPFTGAWIETGKRLSRHSET